MFKRIMSILLVIALVSTMVPVQIFATEVESAAETTEATTVPTETAVETTEGATVPTEAPTVPTGEPVLPTEQTVPVTEESVVELPGDVVTEEAAATVVASGYCGLFYPYENLSWTLYSDGSLEITGSGKMGWGDWKNKGVEITSVSLPDELTTICSYAFSGTAITHIDIPDTVETIGSSAFSDCKQLQTVVLPSNLVTIENNAFAYCYELEEVLEWGECVKTIGPSAFYRCYALASVYLPDSITDLSERAFTDCTALKDVHIPEGLTEIQNNVFENCTALTEIDIPDSVTSIGGAAFYKCTALETVSMPANLVTIDANVFSGCKALCNIEIPYGVTSIGLSAFSSCSALETIDLPSSLVTIGGNAFYHTALREIDLPGSVTHIGRRAFGGCEALTKVTIPAGIQQIDEYAFGSCYGLQEVTIESSETQLGDYLFDGCKNLTKVNVPKDMTHIPKGFLSSCSSLEHFDMPEGLVSIGDSAFSYCKKLTNVKLPDTLTSIGSDAFNHCEAFTEITIPSSVETYGEYIFNYCIGLVNVNLPKDLKVIPVGLLRNCAKIEYITLPAELEAINQSAFAGCEGLKEINLPNTLQYIGNNAFTGCFQLTEVTIPDSVTDWGNYAFSYCIRLKSAKLPRGMEVIPEGIFALCSALETVQYPDVVKEYSRSAFETCYSLKEVYLPDTLVAIGDYAFRECWGITEIKLPETIERYGNNIFEDCVKLEKVTLPKNMEALTAGIFMDCSSLTELTLPEGIKTLGQSSLSGTGLKKITIPASVTAISGYVFHSCRDLAEIEILGNIESIGDYAFYGCSSLAEITIPESVGTIGSGAFRRCGALREMILPIEVTTIEAYTFSECTSLENIVIPAGVTSIGSNAFEKCSALTDVYFLGTETEWKLIAVNSGNDSLKNVTMHYEGIKDSGEVDGVRIWEVGVYNELTIYSNEALPGFKSEEDTPWYKYRDKIEKIIVHEGVTRITKYSFVGLHMVRTVFLPESLTGIAEKAFEGCTSLKKVLYYGSSEAWDAVVIGDENDPLNQAELLNVVFTDYTDNQNITINYSGSAIAYYRTMPYAQVRYRISGSLFEEYTWADSNGVFRIELGTFDKVRSHSRSIWITEFEDEELDPAVEIGAMVRVTPLEYTQKWEVSLGADAEVSIGEGVGISTPLFEVKAAVWEVSASAGVSSAMNVSLEHSGGKESLEIISEKGVSGNIGVESGITGEVLDADITVVGAEAVGEKAVTVSYGLKFDDFSLYDEGQQRAIATFLLGETLMANPNNVFFLPLYLNLKEYAYDDTVCTVIDGSSSKLSGKVEVGAGTVSIDDKDLFSAAKCDFNVAMSNSQTKYSDGKLKKSMSFLSDNELSLITGELSFNEPLFSKQFLSGEIEITASDSAEGGRLETTSAVSKQESFDEDFLKVWTGVYDHYTFKGDSLEGIAGRDRPFYAYVYGPMFALSLMDIVNIAKALSNGVDEVEYSQEVREQKVLSLEIPVGLQLGLGVELTPSVSYLEELSYTTASGVLVNKEQLLTGKSSDLSKPVDDQTFSIDELFTEVIPSLAEKAKEFFKELTANIKEGLEDWFVSIKEKAESVHNWILSLTYADLESYQQEAASYTVKTVAPRRETAGRGISSVGNYTETKAATVSRSFVIRVTDADTGENVTDLSVDPLTVTVRYTQEDLEAAGLGLDSDVVLDGGIAMYRYSDNGDYFEYIGGQNDLDAMTVTAEITKPGQYVLAVDSCAPQLNALELSNFRSNPTITAYVDDLTGLDVSRLVFMLDGQVKVDGTNAADHYDAVTGRFTYTVSEDAPLAEGAHTMSFTLADTTGNAETYEYSFHVDLTAPVISDVTVTGATNKDSCVEIRAQVSDAHLSAVYAVFSKLQSDGTWSYEASTAMGDMGDGLWGLDYEGDGSTIRVYIRAVDIGENTTNSDTFEALPLVEELTLVQEYIALREGQSVQLQAELQPAVSVSNLQWSVDDDSVVAIDENGVVTAKSVGTAYVTVTITDSENTLAARCRIDVAESLNLDGVQLSVDKTTVELYSTDYPELDILLMLQQNYTASSENASDTKKLAAAIENAYFTDESIRNLFSLKVMDDRRVQILPTSAALRAEKPAKSYSGTITVVVEGKTYETDVLTLAVKTTLPKLKATVGAFNSFYPGNSQKIIITGATVTGITLDSTKTQPDWLTLRDDALFLTGKAPRKNLSGKVYLLVETEEWAVPAAVTLTVKNTYKEPALKLSAKSITLNTAVQDSAAVTISASPADFDLGNLAFRLTDSSGKTNKAGELTVEHKNGVITIATTKKTNGGYKLFISLGGGKEVALTIKTVATSPTVTLKAKGNLDLSIPAQTVGVTPTFKNYNGEFSIAKVTAETTKKQDASHLFMAEQNGKQILVRCTEDTPVGSYTLKLTLALADGSPVAGTVKVTVKKTAIKLKLSTSKLSLNKLVNDLASVAVTSATKGYTLETPVWQLMDKSGKNSAEGRLDISWTDGTLLIGTNGATEYGATYKVLVKATSDSPAQTLTITIPVESKSGVTVTLKTKGNMDVIRDGSAVTVTPTYKNCASDTDREEILVFSKIVGKQTTDAGDLFTYTSDNGTFSVTKAAGAVLDHSAKYTVKLVTKINGVTVAESKAVSLSVKMGSAKLMLEAENTTLFAKDRYDRVQFRIGTADAALNDVARVEIKDAKYRDLFEVFDYGNGEFAIGFKDAKVDGSLSGKTVTLSLNVFLTGNETSKANATVKLKLTIVK